MAKRSRKKGALPEPSLVPSWSRQDWFLVPLLLVAVFVAYQPVWYAGFVWDDDGRITNNPCVIGPLGLKEIWTTSAADLCPLVITSFWVEHALWGLRPLPYHLVNVFLHGACAILLWRILRMLQIPGAWFGAAMWALHPVQVETVAWVTEMKNTQSGLFYLLTGLSFIKGLKARAANDQSAGRWLYALTLVFAALALASKSSTVILPIVLGLCAWWVEGKWNWRNVIWLAPIALMALAPSALTLWTQTLLDQGPEDRQYDRSLLERLATSGDAIWFYLGKLLWPHPLIFIYPRWKIDASSWISYLPLLAAGIILFILWLKRKAWGRPYFFAFAYFVGALLPVLGLIDGFFWRYSLVGDHFQYLASMGPLALIGAGVATSLHSFRKGNAYLEPALCGVVLLTLGTLSWRQCWMYSDVETLWRTTIQRNPTSWLAYHDLGSAVQGRAQMAEAIDLYEHALRIKPDDAEAHGNLGIVLAQLGRTTEAIEQYNDALQVQPMNPTVRFNLAVALQAAGRTAEAIAQYGLVLKIKPDDADAHTNLGVTLMQAGHVPQAVRQFQEALALKPNSADAHNNLGVAMIQSGQTSEAVEQFEQALKINPNHADALDNLEKAQASLKAPASKK